MRSLLQDEKTGIMYRLWQVQEPKAVLLLVHGLGAHTGRWEFLGDFFQKNNISSYALELKGFGQTQGERGHIDSWDIYFQDIGFLYDIIKQENPGEKIFLLGESMGALICFIYVALTPQLFSGLICISPSFTSKLRFGFWQYLSIWLALIFNPRKQFPVPITSQMCTRDLEYQKIIDTDPLDKHMATARLYWNIFKVQIKMSFLKEKILTPLLVLSAGKDTVVDSCATSKVFTSLKIQDKEIINYPGMHHALSVDLEREKVFNNILEWLKKRC